MLSQAAQVAFDCFELFTTEVILVHRIHSRYIYIYKYALTGKKKDIEEFTFSSLFHCILQCTLICLHVYVCIDFKSF